MPSLKLSKLSLSSRGMLKRLQLKDSQYNIYYLSVTSSVSTFSIDKLECVLLIIIIILLILIIIIVILMFLYIFTYVLCFTESCINAILPYSSHVGTYGGPLSPVFLFFLTFFNSRTNRSRKLFHFLVHSSTGSPTYKCFEIIIITIIIVVIIIITISSSSSSSRVVTW